MTLEPRVLHLETESTWRGGGRQVLFLLDGLAERGIPSLLAAQRGKPLARKARAAGHPLRELRMRGELDALAVLELIRLVQRGRFDLIHAHTSHARTLGALAAGVWDKRAGLWLHVRVGALSQSREGLAAGSRIRESVHGSVAGPPCSAAMRFLDHAPAGRADRTGNQESRAPSARRRA